MHRDQLSLDVRTVRQLVDDQFPHWRHLTVRELPAAGTVNAIFRIGDGLAARFPLRIADPAATRTWLMDEAEAARELAEVSTVRAPIPIAIGQPGSGYPLPWSVQTWVAGYDAIIEDPAGSTEFAHDLAAFIKRLRSADTLGRTFKGDGRGGHLHDHDKWMETCFRNSQGLLDVRRLKAMWSLLRDLPEVDPDVMCHGDLTPPNVLVGEGRLTGVLDAGGFAPADPALDLVSAWHLLDARQRTDLREALDCSDVQWRRGMAWAFQQSMGLVWYYAESNPVMSGWGRRTLDRLSDAGVD
jgi:aminoglycoside phosphotransferase (APT) family kinase protein